jgi:two-component system OmpR family sensor kinase
MITDLLTVSRLEKAASNQVDLQTGDLNALASAVVEEQRSFAEVRGLRLDFTPAADLPSTRLDVLELKRALRQVLTNAISYTPEAGHVIVRTYAGPNAAIIEVTDTGIGIGMEEQKHIFELFYRADPTRHTDTGGMGLGLAICKSIVEAHGGSIDVESTPGEGSTFRVTLPAAQ